MSGVRDENLRFILPFGIAMHHAGLHERDRKVVEELFVNQKVQVCKLHDYSLNRGTMISPT